MDESQKGSCCKQVKILTCDHGCLLDIDIDFFESTVFVLEKENEINIDEGEDKESKGEVGILDKVDFSKEGNINCPQQDGID